MEGIEAVEIHFGNMLEELFQQANENIVVLNRSRKIVFINSKATSELQLSNSESNYLKLAEQSETDWEEFLQTIDQKMTATCIVKIINDANQELSLKICGYLIGGEQLIYCRLLLNSLPPLVKSIPSKSISFQQLINGMAQGVVLTDLNGKIITANTEALQLMNREFKQIEKKSYDCLFEECIYDSAVIVNYYKKIANNELANVVVQTVDKNGDRLYLNFVSKIDETLGILITTITDHTETMGLLQKIEHQQALSFMGQNVSVIAHEIRNPMTSIQGFIQMIKNNSEEKEHPYFHIVETELQRMDELLLDMLNFSEPKKNSLVYVNLKLLIEQVIEIMQPKIQLSQAEILFDYKESELYLLYGDEKRLKQLLINLLKNAIESNEKNNTIRIQLRYVTKDCIQLSVADQGCGIDQTQVEKVFDPFYSTKETGTGLGLLLVQAIAKEHNGNIRVESELGKGSTFIIDFKLNHSNSENLNNRKNLASVRTKVNFM